MSSRYYTPERLKKEASLVRKREKLCSHAVSVAPASPMRALKLWWSFRVILNWGERDKPLFCPASTSYWVRAALSRYIDRAR